jgi:hypothetical protein
LSCSPWSLGPAFLVLACPPSSRSKFPLLAGTCGFVRVRVDSVTCPARGPLLLRSYL